MADAHSGMGDFNDPIVDPMAFYWRAIYGQPGKTPPDIVGKINFPLPEEDQRKIEEMAKWLHMILSNVQQYTRNPAYLQPPLSADVVEMYKNTELALPPNMATPIEVLGIDTPDGGVFILQGIANNLESPASFADVEWSFQIDNQNVQIPVKYYDGAGTQESMFVNFQTQLGNVKNPTLLRKPLIVGSGRRFSLVARNTNPAIWHSADARLTGYQYIPDKTSVQRDTPPGLFM